MTEPIFWLACSLMLVAVCLTAVLVAAVPALQELARAARSAEKLFDTLYRELPPTLEAIRLTGLEISDLTDDLSEGVESAGSVVKQVDQSLRSAQRQVQDVGLTTRSVLAGVKAAWNKLTKPNPTRRRHNAINYNRETHSAVSERHSTVPYETSWRPEASQTPTTPTVEPDSPAKLEFESLPNDSCSTSD